MARATPIITAFNSGEFSPLMAGRVDVKYYASACRKMRNMIPAKQGPAIFRGGTRFVAEVKNSANRTWLAEFKFNVEQAYVLEFGNQYVRFFSNHGVVESAPGVPLEVATPYTAADLVDADGNFELRFVQSGDVIYICHPDYAVRKLTRTGAAAFNITTLSAAGGPFKDVDPANTVTVYASAATGAGITLTANSAIFTAAKVGQQIYIEQRNTDDVKQWESGKAVALNDLRRSDGKNYKALNAATTGSVKPTHSVGAKYDGDAGVQWQFQDPGYGWATITAVAVDGLSATATVVSQLPFGCVGAGQASTRWAWSAWSSEEGWPTTVTFHRERLVFARGRQLWFSVAGDFENFNRKDDGGLVADDMAIVRELTSNQSNRIEWMESSDAALLVGTAGDEHAIVEITSSEPFSATNSRAVKQSGYGSRHIPPVRVGEGVLFVQKAGRKIRDMVQAESVNERWIAGDVTVMAEHITRGGVGWMAYQQEPNSIVWAGRNSDGALIGMTLDRQQDVRGWHPHPLGANGVAECGACIPTPTADRDELWLIVRVVVNGATKRYVVYMEHYHEEGDALEDAFYVDYGLTYEGPAVSVLSGLGHLEGMTVKVLTNGATHPDRVVTGGSITLATGRTATKVHVGIGYRGIVSPMPIEAGSSNGSAQAKKQRVTHLGIRFFETLGAKYGRDDGSRLDVVQFRSGSDPMGAPPPLFSGDMVVPFPDGNENGGRVTVIQDDPLPCCVVALIPDTEVQDRMAAKRR